MLQICKNIFDTFGLNATNTGQSAMKETNHDSDTKLPEAMEDGMEQT